MNPYSPSPSGRGRGEGRVRPGRTLSGPRLPYTEVNIALSLGPPVEPGEQRLGHLVCVLLPERR
jgi:hypothetical protein